MNGLNETIIFTDGSSRGNPGPGGWGCVLIIRKQIDSVLAKKNENLILESEVIELGGFQKDTTNNRMEITAAIEGLSLVSENSDVKIFTDSSYVINGITKWIHGWKRNGWLTKIKDEVLNKDLWIILDHLTKTHKITWEYVGGHVGIVGNERCDEIATSFARNIKIDLYRGLFSNYKLSNILELKHDENKFSLKKSSGSRSKIKAYSYISSIKGIIKIHNSWDDCEKRVKGVKGAKYRKSLNADNESSIISEFNG